MYLTKLILNPRIAQARRDLSDPYDMHRTLSRAFVADKESSPARFLWLLESGPNAWSSPIVLVQASTEGRWGELPKNYLHRPVESKKLVLEELVCQGGLYRFRLIANPIVSRLGKRYGLQGEVEQLSWLDRQGERHGFRIHTALTIGSDVLASRKGAAVISVQRASFEGVLKVEHVESFKSALISGVGPAKAFGCGLLSVAPI